MITCAPRALKHVAVIGLKTIVANKHCDRVKDYNRVFSNRNTMTRVVLHFKRQICFERLEELLFP